MNREETLEFAVGGDYVDQEGALIEVEVWDYHWVNAPSALTWISSPGSVPWCAPGLLFFSGSPSLCSDGSQTLPQPQGSIRQTLQNKHTRAHMFSKLKST